ncbi:hypothetical protein [Pontibacter flavimaris]
MSGPARNGISGYNKVMARALAGINGPGWEQKLLETIEQLNEGGVTPVLSTAPIPAAARLCW